MSSLWNLIFIGKQIFYKYIYSFVGSGLSKLEIKFLKYKYIISKNELINFKMNHK